MHQQKYTMMTTIGLTLNDFCTIKGEIKQELKNNAAVNCGDFDEALRFIVNSTISKIKQHTPATSSS